MKIIRPKIIVLISTLVLVLLLLTQINYRPEKMTIALAEIKKSPSAVDEKLNGLIEKDYLFQTYSEYEPDIDKEKKAVEFIDSAVKTLNGSTEGEVAEIEKYYRQFDKDKLKVGDPEWDVFVDQSMRNTNIWASWCWWRNNDAHSEKEVSTEMIYSGRDNYIVKAVLDDVIFYRDGEEADMNCGNEPSKNPQSEKFIVDQVLEFTVSEDERNGQMYIYDFSFVAISDVNIFKAGASEKERALYSNNNQGSKMKAFVPQNAATLRYSQLLKTDPAVIDDILANNLSKSVIIAAGTRDGISQGIGNGFIVRPGVVATSYKAAEGLFGDNIIRRIVSSSDGKVYEIDGLISASSRLNVAFLKLSEEYGEAVTFGKPDELKLGVPLVSLSSQEGLSTIAKIGIFGMRVSEGLPVIKSSLPLTSGEMGSPLFNLSGEVVGINVSYDNEKTDGGISLARPADTMLELVNKLKNQQFADIKAIDFKTLNSELAQTDFDDESLKVSSRNGALNSYNKLPSLLQFDSIKLAESTYAGGRLSLVYRNNISDYLGNQMIINAYGKKLEEAGFTAAYQQERSITYVKGDEVLRILEKFNRIIVIYEK